MCCLMDRLTLSSMVVTELLEAIRKMGTHRGPSKNSQDGMRVDFPWAIFRWKFHIKIHGKYALGNKKPNCMRKVEISTGIKSVV